MITEARIREIVREEIALARLNRGEMTINEARKAVGLPRISREEAIRQQREGPDPALLCPDEPVPDFPPIRGADPI